MFEIIIIIVSVMSQKDVTACHRQVIEMVSSAKSRLNSIKINKLKRHFKQIYPLAMEDYQQSNKQNQMGNRKTNLAASEKEKPLTERSFILQSNSLSELLGADLCLHQFIGQEEKNEEEIDNDGKRSVMEDSFVPQQTDREQNSFRKQYQAIQKKHKLSLYKIHRLEQENNLLQREIQQLKRDSSQRQNCCRTQQIGVNTEFEQANTEENIANSQLLNRLMELQDQNSRQLQRIIELTPNGNGILKKDIKTQTYLQMETNENCAQTELTVFQIDQFQIKNTQYLAVLRTVQEACVSVSKDLGFSLTSICNFDMWLHQIMNINMKNSLLPLECEIRLLNQIIQSNKKSSQERQRQKSQLLSTAHRTIQHLLQQIKETQLMAKINYKGLLDFERKAKNLKQAELRQ